MMGERDLLRLTGTFDPAAVTRAMAAMDVEVVQAEDHGLTLAASGASSRLPAIFAGLAAAGAEVRETTLTQPNLESLFIKLTGKELRE
jgi:ABC-2 type transport system ATP-binding protein